MRAQSGADRIGADARRRAVVAEEETPPAKDRFAPPRSRHRRRAGAGDDQGSISAAMRAKARGHRVVDGPNADHSLELRLDPLRILLARETGQAQPERNASLRDPIEASLGADAVNLGARSGDRAVEIDVDIGGRPLNLRENRAGPITQTRPTARRAAVDAEKEMRSGLQASPLGAALAAADV